MNVDLDKPNWHFSWVDHPIGQDVNWLLNGLDIESEKLFNRFIYNATYEDIWDDLHSAKVFYYVIGRKVVAALSHNDIQRIRKLKEL